MTSRLSRSITADSKKLRSVLTEYNNVVSPEEQLSWEDVTNLSSPVWLSPFPAGESQVPRSVRLSAINALLKKQRAIEEKVMIKSEMDNVLQFFLQQHTSLTNAISQLQSTSSNYYRGAMCLLKIKQYHYEKEIRNCIKLFSSVIEVPEVSFPLESTELGVVEDVVFSTDLRRSDTSSQNDNLKSIQIILIVVVRL